MVHRSIHALQLVNAEVNVHPKVKNQIPLAHCQLLLKLD